MSQPEILYRPLWFLVTKGWELSEPSSLSPQPCAGRFLWPKSLYETSGMPGWHFCCSCHKRAFHAWCIWVGIEGRSWSLPSTGYALACSCTFVPLVGFGVRTVLLYPSSSALMICNYSRLLNKQVQTGTGQFATKTVLSVLQQWLPTDGGTTRFPISQSLLASIF